jgi:hypothetical protein
MIQRDGRGIRHGNLSGTVRVRRVVTEGTFDAYMWQTLERKSRSFDALYASGSSARELEDVSGATLSYGEVKALAAGNPLLLEQANARTEVKKLRLLRAVHLQGVNAAKDSAKRESQLASSLRRQASTLLDAQEVIDEAGLPSLDRADLIRRVNSWQREGRTYDYFHLGRFRISASQGRRDGHTWVSGFDFQLNYRTVETFDIDRNFARKSARTVGNWLADRIEKSMTAFDTEAERLIRLADRHDARAAAAAAAVESAVFDRDAELAAAVERLAEIDAAISEQVVNDQKHPVAA